MRHSRFEVTADKPGPKRKKQLLNPSRDLKLQRGDKNMGGVCKGRSTALLHSWRVSQALEPELFLRSEEKLASGPRKGNGDDLEHRVLCLLGSLTLSAPV